MAHAHYEPSSFSADDALYVLLLFKFISSHDWNVSGVAVLNESVFFSSFRVSKLTYQLWPTNTKNVRICKGLAIMSSTGASNIKWGLRFTVFFTCHLKSPRDVMKCAQARQPLWPNEKRRRRRRQRRNIVSVCAERVKCHWAIMIESRRRSPERGDWSMCSCIIVCDRPWRWTNYVLKSKAICIRRRVCSKVRVCDACRSRM